MSFHHTSPHSVRAAKIADRPVHMSESDIIAQAVIIFPRSESEMLSASPDLLSSRGFRVSTAGGSLLVKKCDLLGASLARTWIVVHEVFVWMRVATDESAPLSPSLLVALGADRVRLVGSETFA